MKKLIKLKKLSKFYIVYVNALKNKMLFILNNFIIMQQTFNDGKARIKIYKDRTSGKGKGEVLITFVSEEVANCVVEKFQGIFHYFCNSS